MGLDAKLRHHDFVIIARKGVEELTYQEMKSNLIHVLKIAKLFEEGQYSEQDS